MMNDPSINAIGNTSTFGTNGKTSDWHNDFFKKFIHYGFKKNHLMCKLYQNFLLISILIQLFLSKKSCKDGHANSLEKVVFNKRNNSMDLF